MDRLAGYLADGTVRAEHSGTVLEIASAGAVAAGKPVAVITDESGGYRARASLPQADAQKLLPGAAAEVVKKGGYFGAGNQAGAALLSLGEPGADGRVEALFRLPEGTWRQGDTVQLQVVLHKSSYPLCVPVSALHQDSGGHYLFVMEEASGVLGTENVLRQVRVVVDAKNDETAAVSGPVEMGAKVVVWSTKPLADADRVRVDAV